MANDFSGDSALQAHHSFESGALTTDSSGNSNTLSLVNTPTASATQYKEGSYSALIQRSNLEGFYILDSNLSSAFPLKNGDTNKKISSCGWIYFNTLPTGIVPYISGKWDSTNNKRSLLLLLNTNNYWQFAIGYNGGNSTESLFLDTSAPTTGRWYHWAYTLEDNGAGLGCDWKLVVWDDTASSKVVNTSGTSTNNINIEDGPFVLGHNYIGGFNNVDAYMDENVVFNDILTTGEIDQIRAGTYSVSGGTTSPWYYYAQQ